MIKVLVADASTEERQFLTAVLEADSEIEVIGAVKDGAEVLELIGHRDLDLIVMAIHMPGMDGVEATRRIMETTPLPIVIVSGLSSDQQRDSFPAMEAGALAVVARPYPAGHDRSLESIREFVSTVKAMAEVRVVRRWPKRAGGRDGKPARHEDPRRPQIVGIGASTGGPAALKSLLAELSPDFPLPIIIVQHMSEGFLQGFVDWLRESTGMPVQLARNEEKLLSGHVYVAAEHRQIGVGRDGRIVLTGQEEDSDEPCPSISWLFRSLAKSYGSRAIGVLLSGMGRDGADSMKMLKDRGAVTIVQNAETCVVNGMPFEAIKLDAVDHILPPERIGKMLRELVTSQ